jgi:hypothetical protein
MSGHGRDDMVELEDKNSAGSEMGTEDAPQIFERPTGPKGLYYNPYTQVIMLGFVCFMCPGLFNALNGVGYAGQLSSETSANANSALYAAFAVVAFFAGCALPSSSDKHCNSLHLAPSTMSSAQDSPSSLVLLDICCISGVSCTAHSAMDIEPY